jgi:SpoIIAA-like
MAIQVETLQDGKLLVVRVSGKLEAGEYEHFTPLVDGAVKRFGKIRVAVVMKDFHGWSASGLWEDTKFDLKHFRDIERLAMVGEKTWEKGMAIFCKPFTTATIRYFDIADEAAAMAWVQEA